MRFEDLVIYLGPIGIIVSIISAGYAVVEKLKSMHIENSQKLMVIATEIGAMKETIDSIMERLTYLERRDK